MDVPDNNLAFTLYKRSFNSNFGNYFYLNYYCGRKIWYGMPESERKKLS